MLPQRVIGLYILEIKEVVKWTRYHIFLRQSLTS